VLTALLAGTTIVDAAALPADLRTLDELAGLALAVRRRGGVLRLHRVPDDLRALIRLAGLERAIGA
jgi:hypothetical protein